MLIDRFEELYGKYGGRLVYPFLFISFFLVQFIGALGMSYPAMDPNELSVIAVSQFFAGKSWSGVMCAVDYYYGFLQGLLYTPAALIFSDPQAQYTAMLAINSLMMALIPILAFSAAKRLGVDKFWKLLAISLVSGGFCCYFAHSKFAWTETTSIVIPWILLWLLFRIGDVKSKAVRALLSTVFGIVCALSLAAHIRLIAVVLAIFAAIFAERFFFGKKSVLMPFFLPAFGVFSALVAFISQELRTYLWCQSDPSLLKNTVSSFFADIAAGFEQGGVLRLLQTFCGQLYYFVTATWGVGAIAVCLFGAVAAGCIRRKKGSEEVTYGSGASVFAFFSFFTVFFMIIIGTLYRFGSDSFGVYQDTALFGRFLDGVIPIATMFVMVILFSYSISLNKVLGSIAVLGVIYLAFFASTVPMILECGMTRIAPVLALYPLRIGAASDELLSFDSLLLTASVTFCVMALFIVVISCTKKYRSLILSGILLGITVYSAVFIQAEYLPMCRNESESKNSAVADISESVYNQVGAPPVTAYKLSRHETLMLQFLNRDITVRITYDIENIPENCYLAVKAGEDVSALANSRRPFLLVNENKELKLYAYGERAVAYMRSQNIGENEDTQETLIPEKTTALQTTAPQSVPTERTTERTPMISTYTTPAVITVPAEEFNSDDEWASIE